MDPHPPPVLMVTMRLLRARVLATGMWCPRCMLPSGVDLELLVTLGPGGPPRYMVQRRCPDCHREIRPEQ